MVNESLFNLTSEESKLTERLKKYITQYIAGHGGQISVSKYMELALYSSPDGYYTNLLHKFGREGDFITAPLVSKLFATCLSRQLHELFSIQKCNSILEIGAGNGQLMLDLLAELSNEIEFYYVLELSPNLAKFQKDRLQSKFPHLEKKVKWLDNLPTNFNGVILANEILDAQPCEVIQWDNKQIKQQMVTVDIDGNFIYTSSNITNPQLQNLAAAINIQREVYTSEINLINRGFIKSLAETLHTGHIILVDYGYGESEYYAPEKNNGTLRSFFRQHQLDDIFYAPGLIDITANVDFTAVATTGIDNGLDLIGYTTQGNFLLNCGLLEIMQLKYENVSNLERHKLNTQLDYLTSPNEMGNIFKVIGFSKNIDFANWLGFSYNDRTHTL